MPTDNTYVFLSHSHYDFDKVCRLRNLLEAEGFKPLMFFLKAFENPKFEPMLKPILKEEIYKRDLLILCSSENSEMSDWVKFEEDHIKSKLVPYAVIDLNGDIVAQIAIIKLYRRRISRKVFISYPRTLSPLVDGLTYALQANGFKTWVDCSSLIDNNFQEPTFKAIDKAAEEGYVLYLVDGNRYGEWQRRELHYALQKSALVIPVIVAGDTLPDEFIFELGHIPWLDVRNLPEDEQIHEITQALIKHNLSLNKD
jgi:hypothetical protein